MMSSLEVAPAACLELATSSTAPAMDGAATAMGVSTDTSTGAVMALSLLSGLDEATLDGVTGRPAQLEQCANMTVTISGSASRSPSRLWTAWAGYRTPLPTGRRLRCLMARYSPSSPPRPSRRALCSQLWPPVVEAKRRLFCVPAHSSIQLPRWSSSRSWARSPVRYRCTFGATSRTTSSGAAEARGSSLTT